MREMKDSGVQWIGSVPACWNMVPTKHLFQVVSGATPQAGHDEYWDGDIIWITPADFKTDDRDISKGKRTLTQQGVNSCSTTLVPAGSLIFSKRAPIGAVVVSSVDLCTNQGCLSSIPYKPELTCVRYFYYVMAVATEQYELLGSGTTFKEISATNFSNFVLPVPVYEEQQQIVAYLDTKCSQVGTLIANVQAQIEKLKAYKQSVITEVVTRGIDPSVPMKDSGGEWMGYIPAHWSIARGKYLFKESDLRSADGSEELLTVSQYTGITPRSQKNVNMFEALSLAGYKICKIGDIAANTMWMWAGAIGVSQYQGVISPSYNVYRQIGTAYHSKYLDYLLRIPPLVQCYESQSTGIRASRLRLYPQQFLNIRFPVPPYVEQEAMVLVLEKRCEKVDQLITIKQAKIDKLNEYKRSLIYEYVTGKKEV